MWGEGGPVNRLSPQGIPAEERNPPSTPVFQMDVNAQHKVGAVELLEEDWGGVAFSSLGVV